MTVIKGNFYTQFPRKRRHSMPEEITQESTGVGQEEERSGENVGKRLYCGFFGKRWMKQNKWV